MVCEAEAKMTFSMSMFSSLKYPRSIATIMGASARPAVMATVTLSLAASAGAHMRLAAPPTMTPLRLNRGAKPLVFIKSSSCHFLS